MMLIIVEPGTPDGFRRLLAAREFLIAAGGHIAAPCTHAAACPLSTAARWCHFSQRLPRSRDHRIVKSASMPFEDEKFCYLVVTRTATAMRRHRRVLATPKVAKGGITVTLCAPGAVDEWIIERRRKDIYKAARHYDWGDAIQHSG
jgi:ribosomal protein RSM22 (predicted rRNA methylase)